MSDYLGLIYKNKRVLITGHTGFKGSWLGLWLTKLGAEIIGYSLDPPTEPNLFECLALRNRITHLVGDVRDGDYLTSVLKQYQPEFVFHMAAQPLVRLSYREPKSTYETNVMGTVNILEAVRMTDCTRVCIIITSDKCYDPDNSVKCHRETDPVGGYDPYSSSKGCAELVTNAYRRSFFSSRSKTHNIALASVRAGNAIGGGDWGEDRIIPDCVRALSGERAIMIRNPFAVRPWQYVLEPLSGYLLLGGLMYGDADKYSGPWNFGPSKKSTVTVKELVELVIKHWGFGIYEIDSSGNPPEIDCLKLDPSKACTLLGWKQIYNVHEAVERTVNWYRNFYVGMSKEELYIRTTEEILEYTRCMSKIPDINSKDQHSELRNTMT